MARVSLVLFVGIRVKRNFDCLFCFGRTFTRVAMSSTNCPIYCEYISSYRIENDELVSLAALAHDLRRLHQLYKSNIMGCPMGFGELNIPSSRAFWDDCDEDEIPKDAVDKLQLKYIEPMQDGPEWLKNCKLMLVVEGPAIADFAECALLKDCKKLAEVPSKRSSLHYSENKETVIAIVEEDLTSSGEICDLLIQLCKPQNVITLTLKPKVDYKSEDIASVRDEITFLRSIDGELNYVEPLEAPNFIAGVAAGICSWRCNEGLKTQAYIAYTDNIALDPVAVKPVIKLLKDLNIECSSSYNPKKRDDSHLYM